MNSWVDDWRGYVFIIVVVQGAIWLIFAACNGLSYLV